MLYKQIKRVNELDSQIMHMHEALADLYAERKELFAQVGSENTITIAAPTESSVVIRPKKQQTAAKQLYDDLALTWRQIGPALPSYSELKPKLEHALRLRERLAKEEPVLAEAAVVVAVPPYRVLKDLVRHNGRGISFSFEEESLSVRLPKTKTWSFVIITAPQHSVPITEVDDIGDRAVFDRSGFDMRGLDTAAYMAAALQGVPLLPNGTWTLLLKGTANTTELPCVLRQDGHLSFETDDSAYLVGDNYVQLALAGGR